MRNKTKKIKKLFLNNKNSMCYHGKEHEHESSAQKICHYDNSIYSQPLTH